MLSCQDMCEKGMRLHCYFAGAVLHKSFCGILIYIYPYKKTLTLKKEGEKDKMSMSRAGNYISK